MDPNVVKTSHPDHKQFPTDISPGRNSKSNILFIEIGLYTLTIFQYPPPSLLTRIKCLKETTLTRQ